MAAKNYAITATSQGPLVNVITWVFMVIMIIVSLTKIAYIWTRKRLLSLDDYFLATAMTVAVAEQVAHGLGDQDALDEGIDRSKYEQASYASQILYTVTLYFTKATTAYFTRSFAPMPWVKQTMAGLIYGHLAWTIISLLVTVFQCSLPHSWQFYGNKCISLGAFWDVYAAVDIFSDILLTAVPIAIVVRLQANKAQRLSTMTAFLMRLLTIPLIVLRVVFLNGTYHSGRIANSDEVKAALATEVHIHTAIVLTCVPFIKSIIEGLQGGVMTSDLRNGPTGVSFYSESGSHPLSDSSKSRQKSVSITPAIVSETASTPGHYDDYNHSVSSTSEQMIESATSPTIQVTPKAAVPRANEIIVHTTISNSTESASPSHLTMDGKGQGMTLDPTKSEHSWVIGL